ncbi:MAG: phenylalanine--tRNA ligase subunit beta [bacterium]
MKFSYNLLKTWLKFDKTPQEIAELMDLHITEVERLTTSGAFSKVVVGEILEIHDHPSADKLHLTKVDIGTETLAIVCGASNIAVGQKVPVAVIGAVLPGNFEIKAATIRGAKSFGMLCSGQELGQIDKSEGILILKPAAIPGTPLEEALETNTDSIIEPKILSNRPDYMSYLGMAREIAAVLNTPRQPPIALDFTEAKSPIAGDLRLSVKDKTLCPRYIGRVVKHITVKPSPKWMQDVLTASGLRPINNIVDIANYVMLELGNPIHAFDHSKVEGREVVVRLAKSGEQLLGLDGVKRELDDQTLVIADKKKPVAIAGVIGGENSGVDEQTHDLVVEVAAFDRVSVRRTAKRLGVQTDASLRFERGVDVLSLERAMARVLNLIQADCPDCKISIGALDVHGKLPKPFAALKVSSGKIDQLLGISVPIDEMANILTRLGLPAEIKKKDLIVQVPSSRQDIIGMPDIAEEILRIHGSDAVPYVMPTIVSNAFELPKIEQIKMTIRELMTRMGFVEIYTHPFDDINTDKRKVSILNPLSERWIYMKDDLVPELLTLSPSRSEFRIFELNTIFRWAKAVLPLEQQQLAGRIRHRDAYRHARGVLDAINRQLGLALEFEELVRLPGVWIEFEGESVGHIIARSEDEASFSLLISRIIPAIRTAKQFAELPKFPPAKMDMAFVVDSETRVGQIDSAIRLVDPLITTVELFDIFRLPDGQRNIAFHIELRSDDRTLTKEERDKVHAKIVAQLKKDFGATLRE